MTAGMEAVRAQGKPEMFYLDMSCRLATRRAQLDWLDDLIARLRRNSDPSISVLLISLKAGNVGLTLTAANHVIIMDPFWNPYVEEQAMDRAHRIGQQRDVTVHKIVIEQTVEDRILELQKRKREMIESALDPSGQKQMARLSREELLFLFNMRPNPNTVADAAAEAAAA